MFKNLGIEFFLNLIFVFSAARATWRLHKNLLSPWRKKTYSFSFYIQIIQYKHRCFHQTVLSMFSAQNIFYGKRNIWISRKRLMPLIGRNLVVLDLLILSWSNYSDFKKVFDTADIQRFYLGINYFNMMFNVIHFIYMYKKPSNWK